MSFKINRVYTRSGDDGNTALVGGRRVSKTSSRVCSYGEIDELNSSLGVVKEVLQDHELRDVIEYIQQELFDLGSELATPFEDEYPNMWKVDKKHILVLEKLCDHYGENLEELTSFILPGGSTIASLFHLARCIARRAERTIISLKLESTQGFNDNIIIYINRLSDLLFILARYSLSQDGKNVPLWNKESNRKLPIEL